MRPIAVLVLLVSTCAAAFAAGGEDSGATVEEVRRTVKSGRKGLTTRTGTPWPDDLSVVATDPAGLHAALAARYRLTVGALFPGRSAASRDHLAGVLARAYARTVRVAFDAESGQILVLPGRMAGLPGGVTPLNALRHLALREAVMALDHAANGPDPAKLEDPEALRALLMVRAGRAELIARAESVRQGVPSGTGPALATLLTPGERLALTAGAAFIASLEQRDPELPNRALMQPPKRTSVVFHPERFTGDPTGNAAAARLAEKALRVTPLSELLLRIGLADRVGVGDTERALAGLLDAAGGDREGGGRLFLFRFSDEKAAGAFLTARNASRGGGADGRAEGEWTSPAGEPMAFALARSGAWVAEALLPRGADARAAARTLFPPERD